MNTRSHTPIAEGNPPIRRRDVIKKAQLLFFILLLFFAGSQTLLAQTYTFTTAGATGKTGPSQGQVNTAYSNTILAGNVASVNGIQYWIIPSTGLYKIDTRGASGGGTSGGKGAIASAEFFLNGGDTLVVLVGQVGIDAMDGSTTGGGGTFVAVFDQSSSYITSTGRRVKPLLIAGGGGGNPGTANSTTDASLGTGGSTGTGGTGFGAGGSNGDGGSISVSSGNSRGGGGGGFLTDGERTNTCGTGGLESGFSFLNGGEGGESVSCSTPYPGGFGGGGGSISSGWRASGGGGGYSGGGSGQTNSATTDHSGGGGGCFSAGNNSSFSLASSTGDGLATISSLSTGAFNDAGVISIDSPSVFCAGVQPVVVTIQNFGSNKIDSITVNWSVDGTLQTAYNYTGVLDTIGGAGASTKQINIGSYSFSSVANLVKVWTSAPNGGNDSNAVNDTATGTKQANLPPPSALNVGNFDSTSATLHWTPGNSSNSFVYVNSSQNTAPTGSGTAVTADSVSLSGLTRATTYYFFVREICPSGDSSAWAGPFSYKTNCSGPLNGTYSVDPSQNASNSNFASLTDALEALYSCTIAGPVTFNLAANSGPFTGGAELTAITGASGTNVVTLNGNGNTVNEGSAGYFLALNGVKYLTIQNFKFINTVPATPKFGIMMRGASEYITINNNFIDMGSESTSSLSAGIALSNVTTSATTAGDNGHFITITNNEIVGAYYGITLVGQSSYSNCYGHLVSNNIIRDYYLYGIYMVNADTVSVLNNELHRLNRANLSTFYGTYLSTSRNIKIRDNSIHGSGIGSYTAYPMYITTSVNSSGHETEIINNSIYDINTSGTIYGIYGLGTRDYLNVYHNTIDLRASGTGVRRNIFFSTAPDNHNVKNNILSIGGNGTGIKYNLYITTTSTSFSSNNNIFFNNASAGTNYAGYWTANRSTLGDWQTAATQDANSLALNPQFAQLSSGNLAPLTTQVDNAGTPVGVSKDILGNSRSGSTPDIGAYEFTGISGDLSIVSAELFHTSTCYNSSDTAEFVVSNQFGATVDFAQDSLRIVWNATGPMNSSGSVTINTGTLASGATRSIQVFNVDMSQPGTYYLNAYIQPNGANISAFNDTLATPFEFTINSLLSVSPKSTTLTSYGDSVELVANSTVFPNGFLFISEVCHFKTTNGAPSGGWPSYLVADDYIELTGVPNLDLSGITLEQWTTSLVSTYTFPNGTVLGPNGTAVVAVGQMGTSTESPTDYYYHGNGSYTGTFGSTTTAGRILKDSNGVIIDAVVYGAYTFPAAANVSSTEWSGSTPSVSSSGNKLMGAYTKDATNWVNSGTAGGSPLQDPNTVNTGVTVPQGGTITGFTWKDNSGIIDTVPRVYVGPYTTHGTYTYIATYINLCGTYYDTAVVIVPAIIDLAADLSLPGTITCGNDLAVEVTLTNTSTEALDFAIDNATVEVKVTGKSTQTFSVTLSTNTLNGGQPLAKGADLKVPLGNLNIDATGTYYFEASVSIAGDLNTSDNTDAMDSIELAPIADAGPDYQVCSGSPSSIGGTPTAIGGTGPYIYTWGPAGNFADASLANPVATVSANTNMNVKVTDNLGCYSMDTMLIEALSTPSPSISGPTAVCAGIATYDAPYSAGTTYLWTVTGGTIIGTDTADIVNVEWTSAGTGTVKVKQTILAGGCFATTAPYTVTINPSPSITFTATGATTFCEGSSVNLLAIPQTGNTYAWLLDGSPITGASNNVYSATTSGDYTVIVSNSYGCADTSSSITVTANPLPSAVITAGSSTTFCSGDSVILNANTGTGLSYQWMMNNVAISGASNASYNASTQGSYTVKVTNTSGCSETSSSTSVTVNALPTASIVALSATTVCQGEDVNLSAIPVTGATYEWRKDGSAITGATSVNYVATSSGVYTVSVISISSCTNLSNAITVVVNGLPSATITPAGSTTFCQGGSVVLDANTGSGLSYQWNLDGSAISGATSASYTASAHGNYTVEVTNANSCSLISAGESVVANPLPSAVIIAMGPVSFCQGDDVYLSVVPVVGATYQWRVFNNPINGATSSTYQATSTGDYTMEVTSSAGCSMVSNAISVTANSLPSATITPSGATTFCDGASVDLVSGNVTGSTVQWYMNGLPIANATSGTYTASQSGVYSLKVTSTNGCSALSTDLTVTVNPLPLAVIIFNGPTSICQGETTILVGLNQSGASYQWFRDGAIIPGATLNTYDADQSGDYAIQITNSANCSSTSTAKTIVVNPMPTSTITPAGPTTVCSGTDVILNATTGTGLSYQWFNNGFVIANAISDSYTATMSGNYTVRVTNASGCFALSTAENVTINQSPTASISANGALSICENTTVVLGAATVSNGAYQWKMDGATINGANSVDYSAMMSGDYTVVVSDVLTGCSMESNMLTVVVNPTPIVAFAAGDVCLGTDASFTNQSSVSTGDMTYAWDFGDNTSSTSQSPTHAYTASGTYNVSLTATSDQGIGCSVSYNMDITVKPAPLSTFTWGHIGNAIVSFNADDATGTSYNWNFGDDSTSTEMNVQHQYAAGGNYVVTLSVINAEGCETQTTSTINFDPTSVRNTEVNAAKFAVYPNPFTSETSVSYELLTASHVKIEVYDLLGRQLQVVSNETKTAGAYTQVLNASDISPQTLIIRLTIDNKVYNQRVTLVH